LAQSYSGYEKKDLLHLSYW